MFFFKQLPIAFLIISLQNKYLHKHIFTGFIIYFSICVMRVSFINQKMCLSSTLIYIAKLINEKYVRINYL